MELGLGAPWWKVVSQAQGLRRRSWWLCFQFVTFCWGQFVQSQELCWIFAFDVRCGYRHWTRYLLSYARVVLVSSVFYVR
jgi:hypothetical protein